MAARAESTSGGSRKIRVEPQARPKTGGRLMSEPQAVPRLVNTTTRPRGADARINGGGNKTDIGRIANATGRSPEQRQRITKKGAK